MDAIADKVVRDNGGETAEFWLNNFYTPIVQPYDDGYINRSVALGASYHLDRGLPFRLQSRFFFDRGNICVLADGSLSWNGFLFKRSASEVLALENADRVPTSEMLDEMAALESWFSQQLGKEVRFEIPPEVYVRHSLNVRGAIAPLTGIEVLQGGRSPDRALGSFSYDFDFRGGVDGLSIRIPPRPAFNFGIESALLQEVDNLAIVGRSSGYLGIAPSVARILTFNIYQGQAIGAAAALAVQNGVPLNAIASPETRQTLEAFTGLETEFFGRPVPADTIDPRIR